MKHYTLSDYGLLLSLFVQLCNEMNIVQWKVRSANGESGRIARLSAVPVVIESGVGFARVPHAGEVNFLIGK